MPIQGNSAVTYQFVPNFSITAPKTGDVLIYDAAKNAFVNNDGSGLSLVVGSESIEDYSITKNHLSASLFGSLEGQVLAIGPTGELKWADLTSTDPSTISIGGLLDVNTVGAVDGSVLVFDGIQWVVGTHTLEDLSDVNLTALADTNVLFYDGINSEWKNKTLTISDLSDVDVSGVSVNDVLIWSGTVWTPSPITSLTLGLDDITDVTITAPSASQYLKHNGASWVNANVQYADITGTPNLNVYVELGDLKPVAFTNEYSDLYGLPTLFNGSYTSLTSVPSTFTPAVHTHTRADLSDNNTIPESLGDLDDVSATSPNDGDMLAWNALNSEWEPTSATPIAVSDLTDVTLTPVFNNHVLKSVGGQWVNAYVTSSEIPDFTSSVTTIVNSGSTAFSNLDEVGTPAVGHVSWNGSSLTYSATISVSDITGLATVATTGAWGDISGKPLTFTPSTHTHTLSGSLTDVNITTPANRQTLIFNTVSGDWENGVLSLSDLTLGNGSTNHVVKWNGSAWASGQLSLTQLTSMDVSVASPVLDDILKWDGSKWVSTKVDYSEITGTQPAPVAHTHTAANITNFNASVYALNSGFNFASLTDAGTVADGFMKWDSGSVQYVSIDALTDVANLSVVATTNSYLDLDDLPVIPPSGPTNFVQLLDTNNTAVPNGFLRWNALGTIVDYQTTIPTTVITGLSTVATTGAYADVSGTPVLAPIALTGDWADIVNPTPDWSIIQNKPLTFAPTAHGHIISEITGLQSLLNSKADTTVSTLPNLTVDYDTQVTGAKPVVPVNNDFSFTGLNDTSNDNPAQRYSKYLRWNPVGTEIIYEENIDVANITGLTNLALTGHWNDIAGKPNFNTPVDYNTLTNTPDLSAYVEFGDLSTVATTNNYNDLSNKPVLFNGYYASLINIPSTFTPKPHQHEATDILNLSLSFGLNDLNNVNALPTADGDIIVWNVETNSWIARHNDLSDIEELSSTPVNNGYFRWNNSGTKVLYETKIRAENVTGLASVATNGKITNLNDVDVESVVDGHILRWDASAFSGQGGWVNAPDGGGVYPYTTETTILLGQTDSTVDHYTPVTNGFYARVYLNGMRLMSSDWIVHPSNTSRIRLLNAITLSPGADIIIETYAPFGY